MPRNVVFNLGMHSLPENNRSSEEEIQSFGEIIICDPSTYTMDHPNLTVSDFMYMSPMVYKGLIKCCSDLWDVWVQAQG